MVTHEDLGADAVLETLWAAVLQPTPETAGVVVDDAAASVQGAGTVVLADPPEQELQLSQETAGAAVGPMTPERPQQELQPSQETAGAAVEDPMTPERPTQELQPLEGSAMKRPRVQHKLQFSSDGSPQRRTRSW